MPRCNSNPHRCCTTGYMRSSAGISRMRCARSTWNRRSYRCSRQPGQSETHISRNSRNSRQSRPQWGPGHSFSVRDDKSVQRLSWGRGRRCHPSQVRPFELERRRALTQRVAGRSQICSMLRQGVILCQPLRVVWACRVRSRAPDRLNVQV